MRLLFRFHPREDLSHGTFEQRSGDLARTWCCARNLRGATAARATRRRRPATRHRSRSQNAAQEAVAPIPAIDRGNSLAFRPRYHAEPHSMPSRSLFQGSVKMTSLFGTNVTPTGPYQETCGSRFCEPYVLVTSIRLCPPRPEVEVLLYGAWQSTNPDDDADIIPLVWREDILRFDVIAAPIAKPGDVVILINLAEHFDGNPSACRRMIKNIHDRSIGRLYLSSTRNTYCKIDR